jgi:hypothetical protein
MIRIDLVDNTAVVKHVEFHVVPVVTEEDFACTPDGLLPLRAAIWLSKKLKAGRRSGRIGKYLWYRLLTTPAEKHRTAAKHW